MHEIKYNIHNRVLILKLVILYYRCYRVLSTFDITVDMS